MSKFAYKSVKELSELIAEKEVSPVELMEDTIERIEERNTDTNAFIYVNYDEAREKAKEAEKQIMDGEHIGPLHGIPTAIKDLFDFKPGWPATLGGIPALKDNIANHFCTFAERIEQAGAIIVGKTNSPILGFRGTCDNPLFGPTKNPFDLSKNSGGSSGGSAAAVADGLVPFAEGTDGGGSIRIPSAWCGTYGFQPSQGRVPIVMRPNGFGGTSPFVYEGPITRTVEDAAIGMNAIVGYNPLDPFSRDEKINYLDGLKRSIKGWKIAYSPNLDVYPIDERIKETIQNAVKLFEDAGAQVEEVKVGFNRAQKEYSDLWCQTIMTSTVGTLEGLKEQGLDLMKDYRNDLPDELVYWIEKAAEMKTIDHLNALSIRTEIYDSFETIFSEYDLIITPTVASLPVNNADNFETKGPTEINGQEIDPLIGWCLTFFTNFTGHPAASIPAGLVDGLPVGMQIIGRKAADLDVIAASYTFEQLKPWHETYEICKNRSARIK